MTQHEFDSRTYKFDSKLCWKQMCFCYALSSWVCCSFRFQLHLKWQTNLWPMAISIYETTWRQTLPRSHVKSLFSWRRWPYVVWVWLTWLLYHRHLFSLQWIRIQHGNDSRLVSSIPCLNLKWCLTNPLMLTLDSSSPGSVFGIPTFHPTRRHHAARKYWWHGCMSSLGIYVENVRHVDYRWAHVGHSDCAMVSLHDDKQMLKAGGCKTCKQIWWATWQENSQVVL